MNLNKKLLAGAVLAGLAFSANVSAVELGVDDPVSFASEIVDDTMLATTVDDVSFAVGYNFSNGEVRYGRYECTDNLTMDNVTLDGTGAPNVALGAINGEGTSALFFSMTGNGVPSEDDVIVVVSDNTLEDGGNINCAFSIYDQPSQAQAGGPTGQIYTTGFEPVISRESGFVFEFDSAGDQSATADVEAAAGAYFDFVGFDNSFGNLRFEEVTGVLNPFGAQIMVWDIFAPTTSISVAGDISAADPTCPFANDGLWICPDDITGDVSTWEDVNWPVVGTFWFFNTGDTAIPESDYMATLNAVANPGYEVSDVGPILVGQILRNGTQLQAPLAQVPGGWKSRIALTNTGSSDRPYEISVMGESGNIIGVDSTLLVGTVPANGTKVIDLNDILLTFSGKARATVNVTVAAPNNQIQGQYQIVSPEGALTNLIMVRPGTN